MYSWNDVIEDRAENKKKKIKNIIIVFFIIVICGINLYVSFIPRTVHGVAILSEPYRNVKTVAAQQIALTDVGALHYSGKLYPAGTNEYSIDVISLSTGEVYGTIIHGDLQAQIIGIAGRTFMLADPDMWRELSGAGEFGDGYALAPIVFRHWVLVPDSFLGYDIGRDFLPTELAQIITTTPADLSVDLSENPATSSDSQVIKIVSTGRIRIDYLRSVKAELEIDYPDNKMITEMLKNYYSSASRINGRNTGPGLIANAQSHWQSTLPTFHHCQPTKRCTVNFSYSLSSHSLRLPKKTSVMVDYVLTARHGSSIVGECNLLTSFTPTDREIPKKCSLYLRPDSTVNLTRVKGKRPPLPNWDDELEVSLNTIPLQGIPEVYNSRRTAVQDLKEVKKYTGANEDFVWTINTLKRFSTVDAHYSRFVTGLDPSINYHINDQDFPGYFASSFIVPIGPSYKNIITKNRNIVTYSPDWASSDQATQLLENAQKQLDALPDSQHYSIFWYCPSVDQTTALKKFLAAHQLLSGRQKVHHHYEYVRRINVVTLAPMIAIW